MGDDIFIHPSAVIEDGAEIGNGVRIGPFCTVSAEARIGDGTHLISHVAIAGATTIGKACQIFPNAALGFPPQSVKHGGGRTTLVIGDKCIIREGVTMHVGTDTSRGETRVGSNGFFLANTHVAHDCILGDNVTMANNATLAGHCDVGDGVTIGGASAVHQFTRIGHRAYIGAYTGVGGDVIPYAIVSGAPGKMRGFNIIGLKRAGFPRAEIIAMRGAYRAIFDAARPLSENLPQAEAKFGHVKPVAEIIAFMKVRPKRYLTVPPFGGTLEDEGDKVF